MHRKQTKPPSVMATYRVSASGPADDVVAGREDVPTGPALELVARLCDTLAAEGIRYCHWKSNDALDRSARGENDLDLLVSRRDALAFTDVLRRLGFKDASPPRERQFPGVFHSYGLDHRSGKLVHVHAYLELVLGDDMTKNYRLPIEEAYLDSTEQGEVFRVPSVEFEFAVFVVRMTLKHSTPDALLSFQGSLSSREGRELGHLSSRVDVGRSRAIVREHLPFLGEALWNDCLTSLRPQTTATFRVRTAHRLARALAPYARRPSALDMTVRLWRRSRLRVAGRVLRRPPPRQRLTGGGALIAVVGGDGSGKSTAVEELYRWLSGDLVTTKVHLGKPPWSLTSSVTQRAWDLTKMRLSSRRSGARISGPSGDASPRGFHGFTRLTRRVMISRDRYLTYARARRFASRGGIVVSDRYPLPEITLMDAAATSTLRPASPRNHILRSLTRLEDRYYRRIARPDILIVLRVDPDVAVERKRGQDAESSVRPRAEEIWRADWRALRGVVVDADQTKDDVVAQVKSAIWSRL
jgi:thymidylate kinase